jgi:starvation-inducible DNA-binding protein
MKPSIGISEKHIEKSIQILSKIISNETVLYVKTRKAHWNIYGESFM